MQSYRDAAEGLSQAGQRLVLKRNVFRHLSEPDSV